MAETVSSDIYELSEYIDSIKQKYLDVQETTQSMGIFGYLSEVTTGIMQNSIVMSSEYSNEAIPTKAKFEKNIITHALALGIEPNATPAVMNVLLCFPEELININMDNNKFTFDKDVKIMIGEYEFHTDYDIIISKNTLPNGEYVYTAQYNIDRINPLSDIVNPYLSSLARFRLTNYHIIAVNCTIRQVELNKIYKKILTDNPLENKSITFSFDSQLATFNMVAEENNKTYNITPVYDGLYNDTAEYKCNYSFMNANTIRITFDRESYTPTDNCDITINLYTTKGSGGNFTYNSNVIMSVESDRFNYDRLTIQVAPIDDGESRYGVDRKSIKDLKRVIPKEALARGSVTCSTDLNNYFNSINSSNCQLNFFKKIDNPLERLYYAYLLLKYDNNIIPTNTIDVSFIRKDFDYIENENYVLDTGNAIFYNRGYDGVVKTNLTEKEIADYESKGFLYMNPFTCIINKSPFYVSYYLTTMDVSKFLSFKYINQNSQNQFICNNINWKRELFTDRNTYKLNISIAQNISADMGLAKLDSNGMPIGTDKVKVALLLYNNENQPYRWCFGEYTGFDNQNFIFDFQFKLETDNTYDDQTSRIKIKNLYTLGQTVETYGFLGQANKAEILVYVVNDNYAAASINEESYIPGMEGWTLSNIYSIENGLDFFYNYSHIISSNISVNKNADTTLSYKVTKMPVIRYNYINDEEKIQTFIDELEKHRIYIEDCLNVLEDSFGIDFKFYNTYGPSDLFYVDDLVKLDRTNLTLTFKVKFSTITDKYIKEYIIRDIKDYIENIEDGILDLHMPNIITEITTKYRDQLVYFEFVDFDNYGAEYQHIYRPDTNLIGKIPEFLNINIKNNGDPDINLIVM